MGQAQTMGEAATPFGAGPSVVAPQLPILSIRHELVTMLRAGGAVLLAVNRERLRARGRVVYLKSHPEELIRRLRHDTNRPLLQVADPMAKLRELFAARDPLYRQTAHFVVETGRPSVATLVNMIVMQLELNPGAPLNSGA